MIEVEETNIECLSEFHEYKPLGKTKRPRLMMGFPIRSKYDHDRVLIKSEYKPTRVKHLCKHFNSTDNEWLCIYGIKMNLMPEVSHLCHTLQTLDDTITSDTYIDTLKFHGFSCDKSFLMLRENLIPLDMKNLSKATGDDRFKSITTLRDILTLRDKYPWYSNWVDFKLFLIL